MLRRNDRVTWIGSVFVSASAAVESIHAFVVIRVQASVGAAATRDDIGPRPPNDRGVRTPLSVDTVGSCRPEERVPAGSAHQHVGSPTSHHTIVSLAGIDDVVAFKATDPIRSTESADDIRASGPPKVVSSGRSPDRAVETIGSLDGHRHRDEDRKRHRGHRSTHLRQAHSSWSHSRHR